jgi:lipopolysaccharide biosynthesis glycosyltransferase
MSIHVAIATDRAYLPWCATAVASLLQSTPELDVCVHVLHLGDLTADDRSRLATIDDVDVHAVDHQRLATFPSKGDALGGRISWLRVVLPEVLPDVDRAIYLDADTLIVDSIAPLWATPLGGAPIAAVANVVHPSMQQHVIDIGIDDPRRYFNAGVLLMDLARMREEQTAATAPRSTDLTWFDQDALNLAFAGRWLALHPRWNAQNSFWSWTPEARRVLGDSLLDEAMADPAIVHFEGPSVCKPWHHLCPSPYRDRYRHALATTPWRGEPVRGRTTVNRLIGLLPNGRRLPAYVRVERVRARITGRSRL